LRPNSASSGVDHDVNLLAQRWCHQAVRRKITN
jgi:hypothetical protein